MNKPIAITVPKSTKNFWLANRKERKPIMSVKIAISSAPEVNIAPFLIALVLISVEKSLRVSRPSVLFSSSSRSNSLNLATT